MTHICICSEKYLGFYNALFQSLKKHAPKDKQILYFIGSNVPTQFDQVVDITDWFNNCDPYYNELTKICSLRARVVLDAFDRGYEKVLFLGAKLEFFDSPYVLEALLEEFNAVVTPHILEPLPEDGFFPSNASVAFTGHISTDLIAFKDRSIIREFLTWQDNIMKTKCVTTNETYLDQTWLNFLPFFVDKVKILRDPRFNIAYWNKGQRKTDEMVCFQYSGLDLDRPETISTHQKRYKAEGEFLEFLQDYARRVKSYETK